MNQSTKSLVCKLITQEEGFSQFPYKDIFGTLTIGYGRNLVDRGISASEALFLLEKDVEYYQQKLCESLTCFLEMNEARQIALISMCFNLGVNGFLKFHKMIDALNDQNYELASSEMLNSKWAEQIGKRAQDLAIVIELGELPCTNLNIKPLKCY